MIEMIEPIKPVYTHTDRRKTEWEMTRRIDVHRLPDGSVQLRIIAESEREDAVSLPKLLSAKEAEKLGRVLLCMDDTPLDGLIERAAKYGDNTDE